MPPISSQITFRDMSHSDAVHARILERVQMLGKFHPRIISCHVTIQAPHRHQKRGRLYNVRIDMKVPRGKIAVNHDGPTDPAHKDIYVAIRDAFDAANRRLEDAARRSRGAIKTHSDSEDIRLTSTKVKPASRSRKARMNSIND